MTAVTATAAEDTLGRRRMYPTEENSDSDSHDDNRNEGAGGGTRNGKMRPEPGPGPGGAGGPAVVPPGAPASRSPERPSLSGGGWAASALSAPPAVRGGGEREERRGGRRRDRSRSQNGGRCEAATMTTTTTSSTWAMGGDSVDAEGEDCVEVDMDGRVVRDGRGEGGGRGGGKPDDDEDNNNGDGDGDETDLSYHGDMIVSDDDLSFCSPLPPSGLLHPSDTLRRAVSSDDDDGDDYLEDHSPRSSHRSKKLPGIAGGGLLPPGTGLSFPDLGDDDLVEDENEDRDGDGDGDGDDSEVLRGWTHNSNYDSSSSLESYDSGGLDPRDINSLQGWDGYVPCTFLPPPTGRDGLPRALPRYSPDLHDVHVDADPPSSSVIATYSDPSFYPSGVPEDAAGTMAAEHRLYLRALMRLLADRDEVGVEANADDPHTIKTGPLKKVSSFHHFFGGGGWMEAG